jgi:SHS2 domain-containing protein
METTWDYFAHDADIGVIGRGPTLEAAFIGAATAVFALMVEPAAVQPAQAIHLGFDEAAPELALVVWLNRLLAEARAHGLAVSRFRLTRRDDHWSGEAWGEPWRATFERGVEVKGATLTGLQVGPISGGWEARCVVDV